MRPIDKGAAPAVYARYEDAKPDLQDRIGRYCSYCERRVPASLAVEHIQAQTHAQALIRAWDNFLLACSNCNSTKSAACINLSDYLWPHADNTLRALKYVQGGLVEVNERMPDAIQRKAQKSIVLTGLDKYPGNPAGRRFSRKDDRWNDRRDAWKLAILCRDRLARNDNTDARDSLVDLALATGMFSIWWTVFSGDLDMKRRFREAFIGTAADCFDANEDLRPRPGGQV